MLITCCIFVVNPTAMKYSIANNTLLSGRADGNVYFRNHVIRGFAMPAYPGTAAQTLQSSNLASISSNWNALTDVQRATWNATTINVIDRMGHIVAVTGKQLYVLCNRNLFNSGNAAILVAPPPILPASVTSLLVTASSAGGGAATFSVSYTPTPVPAGSTLLVYGTKPFTPGTYRPSPSQYKFLKKLPATTASPQDLSTEWNAIYGGAVSGAAVFAKVIVVSNARGLASAPVTARVLTV